MKKILKLAKQLEEARADIKRIDAIMAPLKETKDAIQLKLMEAMKKIEIKSIKTNTHSYSHTIKKDVRVVDEQAVIESLDKKYREVLVEERLRTINFKKYAKNILKETGEMSPGTELTETEYISIKTVKSD